MERAASIKQQAPDPSLQPTACGSSPFRGVEASPEQADSLLSVALEARATRMAEDGMKEGGRRRYPVVLRRDADGRWAAGHHFSSFGELEIVKVLLLGDDQAVVVGASIAHPERPEEAPRSPFGPGEPVSGLQLPRLLFGTDARRAELVEPYAVWKPGEVVAFETRGNVEAGALVCRRKGAP